MDQKELVRKGEGADPDRFTLFLVLHLANSDDLFGEARVFVGIVHEWFAARGNSGELVHLAAVADPPYHSAVRELFEVIHAGDLNIRHVFEKIPFRIEFYDQTGTLASTTELIPAKSEQDSKGVVAKFFQKFIKS